MTLPFFVVFFIIIFFGVFYWSCQVKITDRFLVKENFNENEQNQLILLLKKEKYDSSKINQIIQGLKQNLMSINEFPSYLFGGNVAIVGSGNTLNGRGFGHEIDKKNAIVRFNNFPRSTDKYFKDIGSKTDIVVINQTLIKEYKKYDTSHMLICLDSSLPGVIYEYLSEHKTKIWTALPSFHSTNINKIYTTGYYGIILLKDLFFHVNLYGFGGRRHFFNNAKFINGKEVYTKDIGIYKAHPIKYEHLTYKLWNILGTIENHV